MRKLIKHLSNTSAHIKLVFCWANMKLTNKHPSSAFVSCTILYLFGIQCQQICCRMWISPFQTHPITFSHSRRCDSILCVCSYPIVIPHFNTILRPTSSARKLCVNWASREKRICNFLFLLNVKREAESERESEGNTSRARTGVTHKTLDAMLPFPLLHNHSREWFSRAMTSGN